MPVDYRRGFIAIIVAITGYAFLPIFANFVYRAVPDFQTTDIALWRFIFATPIIWGVIIMRQRRTDKPAPVERPIQILKMMSLGILYAIAALSVFAGIRYIPTGIYIVIFYTYPAMVAMISVVLGVRLSALAWVAIGLTLIGLILTIPDFNLSDGNTVLLGVGIALINALSVAIYFLLVGDIMQQSVSVARGTAWVITGTLLVLSLAIPLFGLTIPTRLDVWGLLLAIAVFGTAMPIFLINIGIQQLGSSRAAIISVGEPVLAMIFALIFLGEIILPLQWVGAAFIIAPVVILEVRPRRKRALN